MPDILVALVSFNGPIKDSARKKICKLCDDVFALIHEMGAFVKAKNQSSIQIVTLQKNATNAMNKEFQRTLVNF
jgi:hypothetical protein